MPNSAFSFRKTLQSLKLFFRGLLPYGAGTALGGGGGERTTYNRCRVTFEEKEKAFDRTLQLSGQPN